MDEDFLEYWDIKLAAKQHWMFNTFIINLVIIGIIWMVSFIPAVIQLGSIMTGLSPKITHIAIMGALGLWGVFAFAFWLAPAIAIVRARRDMTE